MIAILTFQCFANMGPGHLTDVIGRDVVFLKTVEMVKWLGNNGYEFHENKSMYCSLEQSFNGFRLVQQFCGDVTELTGWTDADTCTHI